MKTKTYRVWMRDGYATLQTAETEEDAKQQARAAAAESCREAVMTAAERLQACTVRDVECLSD